MRKISLIGTVFIFSIFAIFLTACTNVATSEAVEQTDKSADGTSAVNNTGAPARTEGAGKAFSIDFAAEPKEVKAGVPATLIFTVKNKQGDTIKDLQIVHEKPMHLLVVSKDLAEFYHVHPEQSADGSYRVTHNFPNGGEYRLYADFTPQDATQVVEQIDLKVTGAERPKVALTADTKFEKTVDGLRVVMKPSVEIRAEQELMLDFQAFDAKTNKPATDLQNYLGELAHFVLISEDLKDFVHAHPMSKSEHNKSNEKKGHDADGHTHSTKKSAALKQSVSEVSAHTAFPRAGLYKIWAQFQRAGKVITVPFIVNVRESDRKAQTETTNIPVDAISVKVSGSGYEPSSINVKKNQPVKLAFTRTDANNCGGEVVFAKQNITKKLPVGETILIEFTPQDAGEIAFTCGMGMYKGKVIVQ